MRRSGLRLALVIAAMLPMVLWAQWEPPRQLTFDGNPALIGAGNGKFLAACGTSTLQAIWLDGRDGPLIIHGKRSTDAGLNWLADENMSQGSDTAWCPSVVGQDNMLHLAYRVKRGTWRVCCRLSTDEGATWSTETALDTTISMAGGNVTEAAQGQYVHAMWGQWPNPNNSEIYYSRSTDEGASWLPVVRLTHDTARSEDPAVAVSDSFVHMVWFDTRTGTGNPFYKRSTDYGVTWGADVQIGFDTSFSYFPVVAAAESVVHLAWIARRSGVVHTYYRGSGDNGASWGPDVQMDSGPGGIGAPALVASGNSVHIAWSDRRSGSSQIYYRISTDRGQSWSREETLTHSAGNSSSPALVLLGSQVNLTYTNDSTSVSQVWYRRNAMSGVAEEPSATAASGQTLYAGPTVVRGVLSLADCASTSSSPSWLLDVSGRQVMPLRPGLNDIGKLAAGVYLIRKQRGALRRVLVVR
jgi:hypothetical protein